MNIVITTGELERTDNNTLNYRKVRVNQTMLRCKLVRMDYWVSSSDGVMMFSCIRSFIYQYNHWLSVFSVCQLYYIRGIFQLSMIRKLAGIIIADVKYECPLYHVACIYSHTLHKLGGCKLSRKCLNVTGNCYLLLIGTF